MNEKQLKPVVCIMNPDDIYWMQNKGELPKNADCIITPYQAKELEKEQNIVFPAIRENAIFMLDPIAKDKYIERNTSTDAATIDRRINAIMVIVSCLGGKEFKAVSNRSSSLNQQTVVDVGVDLHVPKVDNNSSTRVNNGKTEDKEQTLYVSASFSGVYSKKGYEQAEAIAIEYGLRNDPVIDSLLKMRHPDHPNKINKDTYRISTSEDLKKNLEVAEELKLKIGKAMNIDIDVDVSTSREESNLETFEFEVEFGSVENENNPTEGQLNPPLAPQISDKPKKSLNWLFWVLGGVIAALAAGLLYVLLK